MADLLCCQLQGANLRDADLRSARLRDCHLEGADLTGAKLDDFSFDRGTYWFSCWTPAIVADFHARGASIEGFNQFPGDALAVVSRRQDGLLLTFGSTLSPKDRLSIEGVVMILTGTSCRLAEYREHDGVTVLRLEGADPRALEVVAEAIFHRVWEIQDRARCEWAGALLRSVDASAVISRLQKLQDAVGASLSDLLGRLELMELRLPDEDAKAMLDEQAATRKNLKLVRTWTPSDNPRTALDRFLGSFDPDEVRLLAVQGPEGADVVANLPAGPATPAQVGSELVAELLRRGLLDDTFFASLEAAHGDRAEDVRKVAALWQRHVANTRG